MNNKILDKISYGVYVVSTLDNNRPTGCIINAVMQVTREPESIAISIYSGNFTSECIKKQKQFGISILPKNVDLSIIERFGYVSGRNTNKFDNIEYATVNNIPVLKASCGYIVCNVTNILETSTHTVFLGEVIDEDIFNDIEPLTYAQYHQLKDI